MRHWVDAPLRTLTGGGGAVLSPAAVAQVRAELCEALAGRRVAVGWVHGDFVPGNVLVDPDSARVTGIVDWVTGSNGPFGVGSQFASLSAPGLAFWKYRSSEPSAAYLNFIQLLTAYRFKLFGTGKPSLS